METIIGGTIEKDQENKTEDKMENKMGDKEKKNDEINSLLMILGISSLIFFGVFLFCSYFNTPARKKTLNSIKDPINSISPSLPRIDIPTSINIIPVQPSRNRH